MRCSTCQGETSRTTDEAAQAGVGDNVRIEVKVDGQPVCDTCRNDAIDAMVSVARPQARASDPMTCALCGGPRRWTIDPRLPVITHDVNVVTIRWLTVSVNGTPPCRECMHAARGALRMK